jgi:hypothetical protein
MHFLFGLLGIIGLYMFRTLLAHPQEALHSGSWYVARSIPSAACETPLEDEQVNLETCSGH